MAFQYVSRAHAELKAPKRLTKIPNGLKAVFIHTAAVKFTSTDEAAAIAYWQAIQRFHVNTRGWNDIGYSWGVSPGGHILEGRGWNIAGGHTVGYNTTTYGICFLGHGDLNAATDAQWAAARRLIGEGVLLGKIKQGYEVRGHREVANKTCPGNKIFPLIDEKLEGITGKIDGSSGPGVDPVPVVEDVPASLLPQGTYRVNLDGERDEQVILIQRFLANRALRSGDLSFNPGPIDGYYGTRTGDAVAAWRTHLKQLGWNLEVSTTWDSDVMATTLAAFRGADPGSIDETPPPSTGRTIIGSTMATSAQMKEWARLKNADPVFDEIIDAVHAAENRHGVDLSVVVAQSSFETAYGRFGGRITADWHNTAGIKTRSADGDDPNDHQRFESWTQGAQAHIDHLALYAGQITFPTPDPRNYPWLQGRAETIAELSGAWAPRDDYGSVVIARVLEIEATVEPDEPVDPPLPHPAVPLVEQAKNDLSALAEQLDSALTTQQATRESLQQTIDLVCQIQKEVE